MAAYYNEIDPYAAAWLRSLIAAGHIAPGDVDERSIEDVGPDDVRGYTQCHWFAGVGVWSSALRLAGWPDDRAVWTGSCPCQPFSAAGKGIGFTDERHLWPDWFHLIEQCKPPVIFGEQVSSKDAEPWLDLVQTDLEALGLAVGAFAFPSAGVGAPHIRDRLYWMAYAHDARSQGRTGMLERAIERAAGARGVAGVVGYADSGRSARHAGTVHRAEAGPDVRASAHGAESSGTAFGVADSATGGRRELGRTLESGDIRHADGSRDAPGELADSADFGQHGRRGAESHDGRALESERLRAAGDDAGRVGAGAVHGFWRDADWLFCRDGKFRPVEPGTQPLAYGAPARVGRLRAYGNAINREAAASFIGAAIDAMTDLELAHALHETGSLAA